MKMAVTVPEMPTRYHALQIRDLSLQVRLGCSAQERLDPQEIRVSVDLRFHSQPIATETDHLQDTLCYARICEAFRGHCRDREFSLIEKLANDLMKVSRDLLKGQALVALTVHKVAPPVEGLLGGTLYRLGDFL